MSVETTEQDIQRKILGAFPPGPNNWRTAGGVSRDTGLPQEEVERFVFTHPGMFERFPIAPSGIPLFAPAKGASKE